MQKKCPRCKYPLVKIGKVEICENCILFVDEGIVYTRDLAGKARINKEYVS